MLSAVQGENLIVNGRFEQNVTNWLTSAGSSNGMASNGGDWTNFVEDEANGIDNIPGWTTAQDVWGDIGKINIVYSSYQPNASPNGSVLIRGFAVAGQTVSIDVSSIVDPDGFGRFVGYTWYTDGVYLAEGRSGTSNPQATEYPIFAADAGKTITAKFTFFDALGNLEIVESLAIVVGYVGAMNGTVTADILVDTVGNDTIYGFSGDDVLTASAGVDLIFGGDGSDTIVGGLGNDVLFGGIGSDLLEGGAGVDALEGDAGNDTIWGETENDSVSGQDGNDVLFGGDGDDQLWGNAGDDLLAGGTGNDILFGGNGLANPSLDGADSIVDDGNDTLLGGDGADILHGLGDNDSLDGGAGNDTIFGEVGNDTLNGGLGNDSLTGGLGTDSLHGGAGNDTYEVDSAGDVVVENAGQGIDLVRAAATYTLQANVENLTLTGLGAIDGTGNALANTITGNAGANVLVGKEGADTLFGGAGDDTLEGGSGTDSLVGGTGDDIYEVDRAGDTVVETLGQGTDTVLASFSYTLGANLESLQLGGREAINGTGNSLANEITGNSRANSLTGLDGNDTLYGESGDDSLSGGAGNDSLIGGVGSDTLNGGAGADTFVFADVASVDTISDFKVGEDRIGLYKAGMGSLGAPGNLRAGAFWSGADAVAGHDSTDRIIYNTSTGAVYYDADGSGSGAAIQFALVTGAPNLGFGDFLII